MNRLVRADLKRIIAKPGMFVVVILMALIVLLKSPNDTAADQMEFYKFFFNVLGLTFVMIPIYLSVYTDEIKSGIMVSVIGMGMSRKKVVKSKLKDSFILLLISYTLLFLVALYKNNSSDLAVTPRQNAFLFLFCMYCVIRGIGVIALSSLVLFLTMSATGGMLVLLVGGIAAAGALQPLQEYLGMPVYDFSFIGLLDQSFAQFQAGNIGFTIIPALIYLVIVININIATFNRKEMDL